MSQRPETLEADLRVALAQSDWGECRKLLRMGADPCRLPTPEPVWGFVPALHGAACADDHEILPDMLRVAKNVDARCPDGLTALMWAAHEGSARCLKMLLEAGANAALRSIPGMGAGSSGCTALMIALMVKKIECVKILKLAPGALSKAGEGDFHECAPFHVAAWSGDVLGAWELLGLCAINERDNQGRTPLMWAVIAQKAPMCAWLLGNGAMGGLDAVDEEGNTTRQLAEQGADQEVLNEINRAMGKKRIIDSDDLASDLAPALAQTKSKRI